MWFWDQELRFDSLVLEIELIPPLAQFLGTYSDDRCFLVKFELFVSWRKILTDFSHKITLYFTINL